MSGGLLDDYQSSGPEWWRQVGAFANRARQAISPQGLLSPADVAGFARGGGLVQAWQDSGRARDNLKAGNYGQAAADYGSMALNTIGEVVPYAKLAAILAPAAKYGPDIWTGASHGQARGHMMRDLPDAEIDKAMSEVVSGFIDSKKGFVDRNKAFDIARREGQLLPQIMDKRGELDSAMLIGNGRTTLAPVPPELMDEYSRLQAGARLSDIGKAEPQGITAYHGSPHDFDKFDMSKIGTGEGAQAYGHGLYFAESEGVARGYQKRLSGDEDGTTSILLDGTRVNGRTPSNQLTPEQRAALVVHYNKGNTAKSIKELEEAVSRYPVGSEVRAMEEATLEAMKAGQPWAKRIKPYDGALYQVRINANPDDFLDWDKPLSEQSERVRKALSGLGVKSPEPEFAWNGYSGGIRINTGGGGTTGFASFTDLGGGRGIQAKAMGKELGIFPNIDAARAAAEAELKARNIVPEARGSNAYGMVAGARPDSVSGANNPDAARIFREAGIPGIKYLDAGSRGAGDGTRNYVVFDDKLVEILKKYGWVPGMAIPAAAMREYEKQAQPDGLLSDTKEPRT